MISLQQLNAMPAREFVSALSGIFESSPWVPERVSGLRPFSSTLQLHEAMCDAVMQAGVYEQLALIRAHPELAGRAAVRGELTPESTREQKAAGLSACSPQELERIQALNAAYARDFGFPFVLAVKGHTPATVIAELEKRVANTAEHERVVALEQIGRIAGFRLAAYIEESAGSQCMAMAEKLARFSEQTQGLTCSYLTDAHRATAAQIKDWMLAVDLQTEMDAVGNVIGRWPAADPNSQTLMTGSHYDTVVNAGKYDGRLGVLLPIAVAGNLKRKGAKLPYTLEIIAFAEEEGVRFKSTFLGSGAVTGRFDVAVLDNTDARGITMREAMEQAGLDPRSIGALARDPKSLLGFIEVHIEQGPVLLSENKALGVVTSIAGSVRALVSVTGLAGHAGTVPMSLRQDAAVAAAEMILAVEKRCSAIAGLVGTVGKLEVPGGAVNVIPGRCDFSIDIRSPHDEARTLAYDDVVAECQRIAARRKVELHIRKVLEINSVPCAPRLQEKWAESIRRVTGTSEVRHLPSGAGHDAMMMGSITNVGMLFVRCGNGGISHHPAESLSEADAELAARVLEDFLVNGI